MRIAILEDDPDQSEIMSHWLENAEHSVFEYASGAEFLRNTRRDSYDLYVLDWLLPDGSGLDVLRRLRTELRDRTPVLVATVKNRERDIVQALESGADDYLVKPVRQRELIARIEAICRRTGLGESGDDVHRAPPYVVDIGKKRVLLHDEPLTLTEREFNLALFFFRNVGKAISRAHILEAIWDIDNADVSTRTIDTHISRLRKKMHLNKENGWSLQSIYQHGYRLEQTGTPHSRHGSEI